MELFSLLAKLTLDTNEFSKDLDNAEKELNSIDAPEAKLELDNDDFNSGIEESQGLGDTFGTEMENVFKGIKTALTVTGIVAAIAGIVNGLKEAVNMTAETADGIDKGSQRLGISKKTYQEWDHALRQSGASINDLQKGVLSLNKYLAGEEVKDIDEAYGALGISVTKANGEMKTSEELIKESLLALSEMSEGAERDNLVTKLFGRGGTSLNALLNSGKEGVKELLDEASDLGLIMSDDEIKNAVAYGDAVANLNEELDAIRSAFVADIIPVLTDAVKWLTDFLTLLNPRLQTSSIFTTFEEINKKAVAATTQVDEATAEAQKLIEELMSMGDYWTLDAEGRMTWDALAARAIELFPELTKYIDEDKKSIEGNTKEINNNIAAWARLQKERILASAMEEKQKAVADQLTAAYEKGAEARGKEIQADARRTEAIKELNKYLSEDERLSEDASLEDFLEARTNLLNSINPDLNLREFNEVSAIGSDYTKLEIEARGLRTEAER